MARILITGSSDGLGSIVAQKLISKGHSVVLHARNDQRAKDATTAAPGAEGVVTGDLSDIASTKSMAKQINDMGSFDCIIHNAGLYQGGFRKTGDGIPALAAVNTLSPFVLTALINKPKRLIFLSSEMHRSGSADLSDPLWAKSDESEFNDTTAYCTSKLHNILFAKAFARRWPDIQSNSLDPGWVATKMGGSSATGSADAAVETYVMLAEGKEEYAKKTGQYFNPGQKLGSPKKEADDHQLQDKLLEACSKFSGITLQ
ncbi:hypothetical protein C7974DRAFT_401218 [Boeremia exigua]|uniref:uncharacterized protein n=1 Tax=Boeremia exigua TaxID=749465 RepID=UPI001E8CE35C|nr:uncharacterized protein C7974DRAFT_401218 [Boeremia exigua]KAH6618967.1 hypothetical protein C7974DRAFT_401218 [Boeremia exigua]